MVTLSSTTTKRMVKMCMQDDFLVHRPPASHDIHERLPPRVVRQDLLGHDGRTLRCKSHPSNVVDVQQRIADQPNVLGTQVVDIAPADDDVFEPG